MAISNRENGGYPVGKIVELIGLEQSGKSLLAAHAIKETQKKGGIGIIIDTESAVSKEFLSAIGVDLKKNFVYVQHEVIEDVFSSVETIIEQMRASNKDVIVTIVVDSVMGASTKDEIEGNYDKDGWATQKAIIISKAMRKLTNLLGREKILLIFTNQLRQNLQARPGMGDSYTTSGGKAIGFHSSIRVKLVKKGKIQGPEKDLPLGITTEA
jgi:recombination protein RecA